MVIGCCDEAHFFRNAKTQTVISTFNLRRQMRLLITGSYKQTQQQQAANFLLVIAFRHTCTAVYTFSYKLVKKQSIGID